MNGVGWLKSKDYVFDGSIPFFPYFKWTRKEQRAYECLSVFACAMFVSFHCNPLFSGYDNKRLSKT